MRRAKARRPTPAWTPTLKQAQFVKALVKSGADSTDFTAFQKAGREAAELAGYSEPRVAFHQLKGNKHLQEYMRDAFADKGVTLDDMIRVIKDGMEAETVKFFAHQGEVVDERTAVDHATRLKSADMFATITGAYPGKRAEEQDAPMNVNVLVLPEKFKEMTREELLEEAQRRRAGFVGGPQTPDIQLNARQQLNTRQLETRG